MSLNLTFTYACSNGQVLPSQQMANLGCNSQIEAQFNFTLRPQLHKSEKKTYEIHKLSSTSVLGVRLIVSKDLNNSLTTHTNREKQSHLFLAEYKKLTLSDIDPITSWNELAAF